MSARGGRERTMDDSSESIALRGRHLRFGWWSLLVFLSLGIALEAMHGFKLGWYLDVSNETRRLLWRLAHAHGVLLGLVHIVFGLTVGLLAETRIPRWPRVASSCLTAASILLPGGFLLGGLFINDGDPGPGILLVPAGALLLWIAVYQTARRQ